MKTVLVTGGAGFIGSHLVERRLEAGDRVVVLDNFNDFYDPRLKESNVANLADREGFHLVRGDIRDREAVKAAFGVAPVDSVVHLAAMPGVRPSVADPEHYVDVNCTGSSRIFQAAARWAPESKIIFGSSSSVYGESCPAPFREENAGERPISPYAASKRAGELLAYTHHRLTGQDVCCLRFFTVYGPRQRPEMAIHKFTRTIDRGETVVVFGDGSALRDFTYITDILDGIERAMERAVGFEVYNLGESNTISVKETIELISQALGKSANVEYDPPSEGDMPVTYADLTRSRQDLGYDPKVPVLEGIARFVAWYRGDESLGDETAARPSSLGPDEGGR